MSTTVVKMGDVAKETLELYFSDLIQDGMYIEASGEDKDFIWMVREAGTDILDLSKLGIRILRRFLEPRLESNKRFFLMGRLDTEEEYFIELSRGEAEELMEAIKEAYGQTDNYYQGGKNEREDENPSNC